MNYCNLHLKVSHLKYKLFVYHSSYILHSITTGLTTAAQCIALAAAPCVGSTAGAVHNAQARARPAAAPECVVEERSGSRRRCCERARRSLSGRVVQRV